MHPDTPIPIQYKDMEYLCVVLQGITVFPFTPNTFLIELLSSGGVSYEYYQPMYDRKK